MKLKKTLVIALALVALVAAGLYANRLLILQYSLGWHTDWKYPREPNHPVAWADGPATGGHAGGAAPAERHRHPGR
jgi:uncharacterized sulfatase